MVVGARVRFHVISHKYNDPFAMQQSRPPVYHWFLRDRLEACAANYSGKKEIWRQCGAIGIFLRLMGGIALRSENLATWSNLASVCVCAALSEKLCLGEF
eukprot:Rmarinus@m.23055